MPPTPKQLVQENISKFSHAKQKLQDEDIWRDLDKLSQTNSGKGEIKEEVERGER